MNSQQPLLMELPDSEVALVERRNQALLIRFSAARLRSAVAPVRGGDLDLRFARGVEITIDHCAEVMLEDGCMGKISEGSLLLNDTQIKVMPIPYCAKDMAASLELRFSNGAVCLIRGFGLTIGTNGAATCVESYRC